MSCHQDIELKLFDNRDISKQFNYTLSVQCLHATKNQRTFFATWQYLITVSVPTPFLLGGTTFSPDNWKGGGGGQKKSWRVPTTIICLGQLTMSLVKKDFVK